MQQDFWPEWADFLSRWKLKPLVCALADSAGPITPVAFQFLARLVLLGGKTEFTWFPTAFKEAVC